MTIALPPIPRADDHYFHPRSEVEVCALVRWTRATGRRLRVRGSGHSHAPAIHGGPRPSDAFVELMLDRLDTLRFDDATMQVTAQAGVHLGLDPRDPTGRSTLGNALCPQLHARGWALPDLGGVSHQTVAGFLATGSAGGSLRHCFADAVLALRIVDGTGEPRCFDRREDPDAFAGALVSLGLLGVVTEVTLQCEPTYAIVGEESCRPLAEAEVDLFSTGESSIDAHFKRSEYTRLLWWPEPGVDRLVVWKARRMEPAEHDHASGPAAALVRKPYQPFPLLLGSSVPMQAAAGAALRMISRHTTTVPRAIGERLLAPVYRAFVSVDDRGPQRFRDTWWQGLPMDDCMDERFMPVNFLEMWLPLRHAATAMQLLRARFERDGHAVTGSFAIELYPGAPASAWLSPGHGSEPSLRINVFCLETVAVAVRQRLFAAILDTLDDLEVRLHWGKHLYEQPRRTALRARARYPRWEDFMALRAACDPDDLFLSDYWKAHLGLDAGLAAPIFTRTHASTARFPLLFRLLDIDEGYPHRATGIFRNQATISAPPAEVFRVFALNIDAQQWVPDLHDVARTSGRLDGVGEVADLNYRYMTVRVRHTAYEPAKLLRASVDAWSLPLWERMCYEVRFTPTADGGTRFVWDIFYDPLPAFARLAPLVRPLFARLFRQTTANLATYIDQRHAPRYVASGRR